MRITVYVVSPKIENFYRKSIEEYDKRLSAYCKIKFILVKQESELIKKIIQLERETVLLLTPAGSSISSEGLADKINSLAQNSCSSLTFLIGCNSSQWPMADSMSLSLMDFSTGLSAAILFEQIYRAYRILSNQPYHK